MKTCPVCQAALAPDSPACPRCGLLSPGTADRTQLLSTTQIGRRGPQQQRFDVSALFQSEPRLVVGRADVCDIVLPHPSVSLLRPPRATARWRLRNLGMVMCPHLHCDSQVGNEPK